MMDKIYILLFFLVVSIVLNVFLIYKFLELDGEQDKKKNIVGKNEISLITGKKLDIYSNENENNKDTRFLLNEMFYTYNLFGKDFKNVDKYIKEKIIDILSKMSLNYKFKVVYNGVYNIKFLFNDKYYIIGLGYPNVTGGMYIDIFNPNVKWIADLYYNFIYPLYENKPIKGGNEYKFLKYVVLYYEDKIDKNKLRNKIKVLNLSSEMKEFFGLLIKDVDYLKKNFCNVLSNNCIYKNKIIFDNLIDELNILRRKRENAKIKGFDNVYGYGYFEYKTLFKLIFLHKYVKDLEDAKKFVNRTSLINSLRKDEDGKIVIDNNKLYTIVQESIDSFIQFLAN